MSIKTRLRNIEKNSGGGEQPELLLMATVYERKNGGEDFGYASALVVNFEKSSRPSLPLQTEPGESLSNFVDRICYEVEEYYGARPKNEQELKETAEE
jgi:hypothetical protein